MFVHSERVLIDGSLCPAVLELDDSGRITSIEPDVAGDRREVVDLGSALVGPSPVDLHFHGACGVSVPPDGTYAELDAVLATHLAAAACPVICTADPYLYLATLPVLGTGADELVSHVAAAAEGIERSSGCRGLRLEGCFLNPELAGAWPAGALNLPDTGLLDEIVAAAGGNLRILDVAPELPGAIGLIEHAVDLGLTISLAHSRATFDEARMAIDAGARLVTHTFNAMSSLHHREPGLVTAALTDPRVTAELICDGHHVHPAVIALALAATAARPGSIACISDASPVAGQPVGIHRWAGLEVTSDGDRLTDARGNLAGAARTLTGAVEVLGLTGGSFDDGVDPLLVLQREAWVALTVGGRRILEPGHPIGVAIGDGMWIVRPYAGMVRA